MSDQHPQVAVIVPTFNRWPHVREAIDSVLAQSYAAVECVVVDDASTDGTAEHLRAVYGPRIRLVALPHNGEKSAARNAGVRATPAPYVCMLDSDDVLTANSVEDRVRLFLDAPGFSGVAYGLTDRGKHTIGLADFTRQAVHGDLLERYLKKPFLSNNAYLLSRATMLRWGMYKEDLTNREDVELFVRLTSRLEFRFCGSYVARVRRVDDSAQSDYAKHIRQGERMIAHLRHDRFVAERLGHRIERLQRQELLELARAHYKARRFAAFRSLLFRVLRRWPGQLAANPRMTRRLLVSLFRG